MAPHFADAYDALFRIENSLRMFVYAVLKVDSGGKWTEFRVDVESAQSPPPQAAGYDGSTGSQPKTAPTLGAVFKRAIEVQRPFEYLGLAASCPLLFVTMRELVGIIECKPELFARYFPGGKIPRSLHDLVALRNAFAHFRAFTPDHAERVKSIAVDAFGVVEDYLGALAAVGETEAPPNTDSSWYHGLLHAVTPPLRGRLFEHSMSVRGRLKPDDGRWITLALDYEPHAIEVRSIRTLADSKSEVHVYTVPNVYTPALATAFPALLGDCICLREAPLPCCPLPHAGWDKEANRFRFGKRLLLTFPLARLKEKGDSIAREVAVLCRTIHAECDALARDRRNGTSLVKCEDLQEDSWQEDGEWAVGPPWQVDFFYPTAEHSAEYWGIFGPRRNFITHGSFPWAEFPTAV